MKIVEKKGHFVFSLLAVVIFFVFVGFAASGEDGLIRLMQLRKIKLELVQKNKNLMLANLEYRQILKSLYNLKSLEYHAREVIGFVYPDEIVYTFQPDTSTPQLKP